MKTKQPFLTIKKQEWDSMSEATKDALFNVAKHIASLTPQELDKIKSAPFRQCGCKSKLK